MLACLRVFLSFYSKLACELRYQHEPSVSTRLLNVIFIFVKEILIILVCNTIYLTQHDCEALFVRHSWVFSRNFITSLSIEKEEDKFFGCSLKKEENFHLQIKCLTKVLTGLLSLLTQIVGQDSLHSTRLLYFSGESKG